MKSKGKTILVVLLPLLVCICVFAMLLHARHTLPSGYYEIDPDFTDKWQKAPFIPISADETFKNAVKAVRVGGNFRVGQNEENRLHQFMLDFLIAYHSESFEDYKKFRFAIPRGGYTEAFEILKSNLREGTPPSSPAAALRAYWDRIDSRQRRGNKGKWMSVSLENSEIMATRMTIIPCALSDYALRHPNNGVGEPRPFFVPSPSPNDLIEMHGSVDCATLFVVVKTENGAVQAFYIRTYWERQTERWAPWELAYSQPMKLIPLF
jgi:hypothetical protein